MSVKAKKHLGQHFLTDESIAKKIADSLNTISPLKVSLCEVEINKHQPESVVKTSLTKQRQDVSGLTTELVLLPLKH